MKNITFQSTFLPSVAKEDILENCRITLGEIKNITQPAYNTAAPLFKGAKFKSKTLQEVQDRFQKLLKSGSENPVVTVQKALPQLIDNLEEVTKQIDTLFSDDVAPAGLTYLKSNILQFESATTFVSKYARKFLIQVYVLESAEYEGSGLEIKDSLTPFDQEWLAVNLVSFLTALDVVSTPLNSLKKAFGDIPDIVITKENAQTLGTTIGQNRIDPLNMGLIPIKMNPFYHIRMWFAEVQADRYKEAKEELRLLEWRALNLERLKQGKPDAKLEQEISHLTTRIQGLTYKINKAEKEDA